MKTTSPGADIDSPIPTAAKLAVPPTAHEVTRATRQRAPERWLLHLLALAITIAMMGLAALCGLAIVSARVSKPGPPSTSRPISGDESGLLALAPLLLLASVLRPPQTAAPIAAQEAILRTSLNRRARCQMKKSSAVLGIVFLSKLLLWSLSALPGEAQIPMVTVSQGQLMLDGQPYYIKGANYVGCRNVTRYPQNLEGVEYVNPYIIFQGQCSNSQIQSDLAFLRNALDVNTIRIFTPSLSSFEPAVVYHGWEPWFMPDGSVNPIYLEKLAQIFAAGRKLGLRVQLGLFLNMQAAEMENGELAPPGSAEEAFYINAIRSLTAVFRNEPALLSYEIGNEMLIDADSNYWQHSGHEAKVLSFIKRMADEIRRQDGTHLIASGEVLPPSQYTDAWHSLRSRAGHDSHIHHLNGGQPFSLYDLVDYIAPHLYGDADSKSVELGASVSMIAAADSQKAHVKPFAIGELGFNYSFTETDITCNSRPQTESFQTVLGSLAANRSAGAFAWSPLPQLTLIPGTFSIEEKGDYSPVITVSSNPPRIFHSMVYDLFDSGLYPLPAAESIQYFDFEKGQLRPPKDWTGEN